MGYNPKWTAISEPDAKLGRLHRIQIWERDFMGAEDDTWKLWGGDGAPDILVDHGELSHDLWKPTVGTGLRAAVKDDDRVIFSALKTADEREYYLIYSISDDDGTSWFDYFRGWCRSDLTDRGTDQYEAQTIVGALCGLQSLDALPFTPFDLEGTGTPDDLYQGKFRLLDALSLILQYLEPGSPSVAEMDVRISWPYTSAVHLAGDPYAQLYNDYSIFTKEGSRGGQKVPVAMTCLEVIRELVIGARLFLEPGTGADPAPHWRVIHPAMQTQAHTAYNYQTADGLPAPDPTTAVSAPTPITQFHGRKLLGGSESARKAYRTVTFIQKHPPINPTFIRIINESLHPAGTGGRATFVEATATNVTGGTGRRLALEVDIETLDLSGADVDAIDGETYEVIINYQWKFGADWIKDPELRETASFVVSNPLESFNVPLGKGTRPKPLVLYSPELPDTTDDVYLRISAGSTGGAVSPEPVTSVRFAIVRLALDDDEGVTETVAVVRNGAPGAYSEHREEEYVIGDRVGSDLEVGLVKGLTVLDGTHQWTEDWTRTGATHYPAGARLHQVVAGDVLLFQNAPAPIHREVFFGADVPRPGEGVDVAVGEPYEGLYAVIRVLFQPLPDYRAEVGLFRLADSPSVPLTYDDIVKALPPKGDPPTPNPVTPLIRLDLISYRSGNTIADIAVTPNAHTESFVYSVTSSPTWSAASLVNATPDVSQVRIATGLTPGATYYFHCQARSRDLGQGVQGLQQTFQFTVPQATSGTGSCGFVTFPDTRALYPFDEDSVSSGSTIRDVTGTYDGSVAQNQTPLSYTVTSRGLSSDEDDDQGALDYVAVPAGLWADPMTVLAVVDHVDADVNGGEIEGQIMAFAWSSASRRLVFSVEEQFGEIVARVFLQGSANTTSIEIFAQDGQSLEPTQAVAVAFSLDWTNKILRLFVINQNDGVLAVESTSWSSVTVPPGAPDGFSSFPAAEICRGRGSTTEITWMALHVLDGLVTQQEILGIYQQLRHDLLCDRPDTTLGVELPADPEARAQTVAWSIFADGDATPSVAGGNHFRTANTGATTITDFDNAKADQWFYVHINDANTTIQDNANIQTVSGSDITAAGIYYFFHVAGVFIQQGG